MEGILEELYHGNINPCEQYYNKESEYGQAVKALSDTEAELVSLLNETEKEIFRRCIDAQLEVGCLAEKAKFMYGFKLGFQIALEGKKEVSYDED